MSDTHDIHSAHGVTDHEYVAGAFVFHVYTKLLFARICWRVVSMIS